MRPNLPPLTLYRLLLVQYQHRYREARAQRPGGRHQATGASPRTGKVHRMRDGIVPIYAQRDQHVRGGVRDASLHEANALAGDISGAPRDGDAPHDVGQHVQQADAQVCGRRCRRK